MPDRKQQLIDEAKALHESNLEGLVGEDAERFNAIVEEVEEIKTREADTQVRAAKLLDMVRGGNVRLESSCGAAAHVGASERDVFMRAVDGEVKAGRVSAESAENAERLASSGSEMDNAVTRKLMTETATSEYFGAFAKLHNGAQGHLRWTPQEAESFRRVEELKRSMNIGTGSAGGDLIVPFALDPSIVVTNDGAVDPMRSIARVERISGTNTARFVTSAGVSTAWKAEEAELDDGSATLAEVDIECHKLTSFVPFSYELHEDAGIVSELSRLINDAVANETADKFVNGSGSGEPTGLITALVAADVNVIDPSTAEEFNLVDIFNVANALAPRWRANGTFGASFRFLNETAAFQTENGSLQFPTVQETPRSLLGSPAVEISNMASAAIDPSATSTANQVLVFGDFRQFVIVDRYPLSVELVNNLFGSNQRPTGQRGIVAHHRVGSDLLTANAFALLDIPTAA